MTSQAEYERIRRLLSRLNEQDRILFPQRGESLKAPTAKGIYIIRHPRGRVWHVGNTPRGREGLKQRLGNHLSGKSSFVRVCMAGDGSKLRRGFTYQYLVVKDARTRVLLEHLAAGQHCPRHIGLGSARAGRSSTD
jgi:hypothetical protein